MVNHKFTDGISLICNLCRKCFDHEIDLINHSLNHSVDESFVCNVCNKKFSIETDLSNHLISHSKENTHLCHSCDRVFYEEVDFLNHCLNHSKKTCNKSFLTQLDISKHSIIHTSKESFKNIFVCGICKENFTAKDDLENHLCFYKSVHKCEKCNKKFSNEGEFIDHQITHCTKLPLRNSSEKDISAALCDVKDMTKSSVANVKISCTGSKQILKHNWNSCSEGKYVCDLCSEAFSLKNDLVIHRLTHSVKDPQVCNLCTECLPRQQDLINHYVNQHSEKPLYKCDVCSKKFTSKYDLVNHGRKHLLEDPHMYNKKLKKIDLHYVCDKRFQKQDSLKSYHVKHLKNSYVRNGEKLICTSKENINNLDDDFAELNVCKILPSTLSDQFTSILQNDKGNETIPSSEHCNIFNRTCSENSKSCGTGYNQDENAIFNTSIENFSGNKTVTESNSEDERFIVNDLNQNMTTTNMFSSELEEYSITYNADTNNYEIFIDTASGYKANNTTSQKLNLCDENINEKSLEMFKNSVQLKSNEIVEMSQDDNGKQNGNLTSSICTEVQDLGVNEVWNESEKSDMSEKIHNIEMYLTVENEVCDTSDDSLVELYSENCSVVSMSDKVCDLNVMDTYIYNGNVVQGSSSIQTHSSDCVNVQNNSINQDFMNAVASIETELYNKSGNEDICESVSQSTNLMNGHLEQMIDNLYVKNSSVEGNFMLADFTQSQMYLPDLLGENFTVKNNVILHNLSSVNPKSHICDICKTGFRSKSFLLRHLDTHSGEKPFSCSICDRRFSRKYYLDDHLLTHSGQKPHVCQICSKSFHRKNHLEKHIQTHSTEKPYACDICGKCFRRKDYLVGHRLIHVDNNPFMCTICDHTFSAKADLEAHRASHAVEISYACDFCHKCFKQKYLLTRHLATHTHEKPFTCDVCGKCFTRKDSLSSHLKYHMKEKPHECYLCKKSFYKKNSFLRHLQTHACEKASHQTNNKRKCHLQSLSNNDLL